MSAIWSDEARLARWLEVELAALEGWAETGVVPREAVAAIRERRGRTDGGARRRDSRREPSTMSPPSSTRSPRSSARRAAGSTTASPRRTCSTPRSRSRSATRARSSSRGSSARFAAVVARAEEHRDTLMIGRTHGVHAEPTTFGLKLAGWAFALERDRVRVEQALEGMRVGKLSGAVGTYSATDPEVERVACERLGLEPAPSSTQILQRDRHAELLSALALLAASLERFALEIRHLARTEVREVEEPFGSGQKGSSAMPHKRNPIVSERICGLARVVRGARRRRAGERRALARAGHLALLRRADRAPGRVPRRRLHARPFRLAGGGSRRPHGADAREPRRRATASTSASASCSRSSSAGLARDDGLPAWCSGTRWRRGTRGSTSRRSSAPTPRLAGLDVDLDDVFDLAAYTQHIGRRLRAAARARPGARACLRPPSISAAARCASSTRSTTSACCSSRPTGSRPST